MEQMPASRAQTPVAEDGQTPGTTASAGPRAPRSRRLRRWGTAAVWALGVIAAFACYLLLARTRAVNSDGASNALQAWDMLHGNPLLRGWSLSDVSFYATELPQYMLVELVRGLNQDVVHVAAAMTYTLAVLLAALLARGDATGRQALVRVLITVGIMLAPQLASGVNILLSSPDHIGTSVPVMLAWLILDRAEGSRTPRDRGDPSPRTPLGYVPVVVGLLLGWAEVADMLALYIGVLSLAGVCAVNAVRAVMAERKPLASQWYPAALAAAAAAGAAAAVLALHVIHASGGFYMPVPGTHLADGKILVHNLGIAAQGLLLLGGADFLGLPVTASAGFIVLHVVGVGLAAWGTCLAALRFLRDRDLAAQLLVTGVAVNLAIYVLSNKSAGVTQTREIAPVLPFAAALAGRLLGPRLLGPRLLGPRLLAGRLKAAVRFGLAPVLAVAGAGYLAGLAREISQPPAPAQNSALASWLEARHLRTGLSVYWESNIVTLTSGDLVQVRTVNVSARGRITPSVLEAKAQWYDPGRGAATFVVFFPGVPGYRGFTQEGAVLAAFGRPARTYHVGAYTVLVWHGNLLRKLG